MTSIVTIFGYGSLMSYSSVLLTMPSAMNFRRGTLEEYSRNFNLVSISGIKSGTLGNITSCEAYGVFNGSCHQITTK